LPRSPQAPSVPGQGHRNALGLLPHAFLLLMAKLFRHLLDKSHIQSCAAQQPAWHRRRYRIWPSGKMLYGKRNIDSGGVAGFAPCATRVAPAPLHRPVQPKGLSPTLRYRQFAKTFCASPSSWFLFSTVRGGGGRQVFCNHFFARVVVPRYAVGMRDWMLGAYLLLSCFTARADTAAFFYALDADLRTLKDEAREIGQPLAVGSRSVQRLSLGPHTIFAIKMGSGCVETAASAQALLTKFRCDWAFSFGPAGALADNLETGRWYRVDRVIAWQRGTANATGFQLAESARWHLPWHKLSSTNLAKALTNLTSITLAAGEEFVASEQERGKIRVLTDAEAVDMNTFGLALVCADQNVPLFVWRIISDRANETAADDFRSFVSNYDGEGGRAMTELLRFLPPNPNAAATYPAIQHLLDSAPK
jgi:nucleoside phosphorylase